MTQEHVALELGVSTNAVSKWELNATQPTVSALATLRDLLDVSLDELICGSRKDGADVGNLSPQEKQLLQWFRKLSPSKRAGAISLLS